MIEQQSKPIGIFDSGLGGISVVRAVMDLLPHEHLIYFGDTARVPYGSKSRDTVIRFAREITHFLVHHDVKMVVVACNTASAVALEALQDEFEIPIVGVIHPGAQAALSYSSNNRIGVIGTTSTIRSEAYAQSMHEVMPKCLVLSQACPLLVPLVEENWPQDEVVNQVLGHYLHPFQEAKVDTLILGCTHYPYLKSAIQEVMGESVRLVDSGEETAREVERILAQAKLLNGITADPGKHHFHVSDFPLQFKETATRFLGKPLENLFKVELEVLEAFSR